MFKLKYQKYKLRVKVWEKDFKKKNGRVPSKVRLGCGYDKYANWLTCCSMI